MASERAGEWLQLLVQEATHPIVSNRTDSVGDFLATLDEVESELTALGARLCR